MIWRDADQRQVGPGRRKVGCQPMTPQVERRARGSSARIQNLKAPKHPRTF